jgi:hypothetical protein
LWREEHDVEGWEVGEGVDDEWAYVLPAEATVAAAEGRDGYGADVAFADYVAEVG